MTVFAYERDGEAFSGAPRYRVVFRPTRQFIGHVASGGRRSTTWGAILPGARRSQGGFRSRDAAAEFLRERSPT